MAHTETSEPGKARTTAPAVPQTMVAITQHRYGPPADVLETSITEVPRPRAGEVLVRVRAAGVDQGTWHLVTGLPYLARLAGIGLRHPKNPVPGLDFAGEVIRVGEGVTEFAVGDEVFGIAKGSFADYALADAAKVARKPPRLGFPEAAVVAVSGLTALQAVRDRAKVARGDSLLVIGASGGVGSYAVQVGVARGAEVTGVARTSKLDFVRSLGAADVIDYTLGPIAVPPGGYDAVLDIGGNRPVRELRGLSADGGRLVIVGGEGGGRLVGGVDRQVRASLWSLFTSQRSGVFVSSENSADMRQLADLIEGGRVAPALDRTYPLADAPLAISALREGSIRGKVALIV